MTREETKKVKNILGNVDRCFVLSFLDRINLSIRERKIIQETELDGETIEAMADKMCLSVDAVAHIKRSAVNKIYIYSIQNNYIK